MLLQKNIPFKYVFGKIKYEMIFISIYAIFITVLYRVYELTHISIPIAIPSILGTVISLLLGFRSNQAYDRWWEARHIWGAVVNDSRTLARQIISFTPTQYVDEQLEQFKKRVINRQIGWAYCLGRHLRNQKTFTGLEKYFDVDELAYLKQTDNKPAAVLDLMGRDIQLALNEGWINRFQQVEIDRTLTRLCDAMGKCERIKNTVFPSTYSLYIHLAMMLFILLLPFSIIEFVDVFEIPLVISISACFLLIEKMAIHLQDPFENKPTDTPMTTIAQGIEKNLVELYLYNANAKQVVSALQTKEHLVFYNSKNYSVKQEGLQNGSTYGINSKPSYYVL